MTWYSYLKARWRLWKIIRGLPPVLDCAVCGYRGPIIPYHAGDWVNGKEQFCPPNLQKNLCNRCGSFISWQYLRTHKRIIGYFENKYGPDPAGYRQMERGEDGHLYRKKKL